MHRRTLLQLPALAGLAQAASRAFRLSGLPVRVEAAVPQAWSFHRRWARSQTPAIRDSSSANGALRMPAAITKLKNRLGPSVRLLFVGNRAVNPIGDDASRGSADRTAFLAEIKASTEAAQAVRDDAPGDADRQRA